MLNVSRIRVGLLAGALILPVGVSAKLPPVKTDPLRPPQGNAGSAGCSATDASSCAQAASKITPIVMGESPAEGNLRR